ncbi:uncharacterized protein LOC119305919 [Triticum dicoccoides]|uniref:uncharacterized protein LOC119305919 n=1 Tax=Triticum dicoccoides TaxID=85692 RepID=UPI00188DDFB6|nr:uncharacterized protein LOC119305919 [Triticum dicoccoides]
MVVLELAHDVLQLLAGRARNMAMPEAKAAAMESGGGHGEWTHERSASTGGGRGGTGGKQAWEADDKRRWPASVRDPVCAHDCLFFFFSSYVFDFLRESNLTVTKGCIGRLAADRPKFGPVRRRLVLVLYFLPMSWTL